MDATPTCLLCGKALSRIRFRNDGPFCCREHRAQHQLRQGMERVREAGSSDALHAVRQQRPEAVELLHPVWLAAEKREYDAVMPAAPRRVAERFHRTLAVVSTARLASAGGIAAKPKQNGAARARRRTAAAPALGRNRGVRPQAPASRRIAKPSPPAADPAFRPAAAVAAPAMRRVEPARRLHAATAPVIRARSTEAAPPSRGAMPVATGIPWQNNPAAAPAAEPRASAGMPFRGVSREGRALALPPRRVPSGRLHAPAAPFFPARYGIAAGPAERRDTAGIPVIARGAAIPGEQNPADAACRMQDADLRPRLTVVRRAEAGPRAEAAMPLPKRAPCLPQCGPRSHCAATLPSPDRLYSLAGAAATPPAATRAGYGTVPWKLSPASPAPVRMGMAAVLPGASILPVAGGIAKSEPGRPRPCEAQRWRDVRAALPRSAGKLKTGPGALGGSGLHTIPERAAGIPSKHRAEAVKFDTELLEFKSVQFQIQGTVAGAMENEVRLEENFATGLSQWAGGIDDWKLDAAGVRTGSLALFTPSIGLRDYDIEFLAKIEKQTVAWVFRAANLENYYLFKLAVQGTGKTRTLQLTRCAVIAGAAGEAETVPVPIEVRSKASFRVQVSAKGQEFTTSVEGQTIDQWSDARLETGGIGFLAEREDRSRLYWVKLSSSGQPS